MGDDLLVGFLVAAVLGALILYAAARAWQAVWRRPRSIERELRRQGVSGTKYRLLYGDLRDDARAMASAWSKPIPLGHRITRRANPFVHQLTEKYGKMAFMWVGTTPRLLVRDPELAKEMFCEKDGRIQTPPPNPQVEILAKGVVASLEGEKWAKRRKLITSAFHVDKLKGMVPAFFASCEQLVKRWEKQVGAEGSCELDVWPEFQSLAADVISRTAFGSCYEEGKRIFELQREQVNLVLEAARDVYIPGFRFVPTPKNRRRLYLDHEIKSVLREIIRRKEAAMEEGAPGSEDLLGLLLQSARDSSHQETMSIEDVIEECKLFYFSGQETTAVLLTWTMIVLSMHQDWQQKAREEVLHVCGSNRPPDDIQTMNQLKTVTMVLNEVLRLYPPAIFMFRHTYQTVELGGISIPAGVDLVLPTIFIHHDREIWGEDAGEFNPERFSQGISKAGKEQSAFFPFGWGPRICLGQSFAMIEARMALSMILQRFSFELSPSYAHAPYTVITLQPQHGAQIILRRV